MSSNQRRLISSALSALILISMIISLVAPPGSYGSLLAQEVTAEPPEATPEVIDPVETAPEATATVPAPVEDVTPVEDVVVPTQPPTETPVVVTEPTTPAVFSDDFNDGDVSNWLLSENWSLITTEEGNLALGTTGGFETATVPGLMWNNLGITATLSITPGNTANIAFRVGADNYNVTFRADGSASLFQGVTLLQDSAPTIMIPAGDVTPRTYLVDVQAFGGSFTVTINSTPQISYTTPVPLPTGGVIFSTGTNNTGMIQVDDITIRQLTTAPPAVVIQPTVAPPTVVQPTIVPPTVVPPTAEPIIEVTPETVVEPETTPQPTSDATEPEVTAEITEVPVIDPTPEAVEPEVTAEVTAEITAEPGIETTPEVETTPEATAEVEPEATTEVTAEPEIEVTAEATAEVTAEPEIETTPEVETTPEATPEVAEDVLTPVAFADFDGQISGWMLSEGTSVVAHGEANYVLQLNAGGETRPEPTIFLTDFSLETLVNIDAGEGATGLNLFFRTFEGESYLLAFELTQTALYRVADEETTLLTSVPAERTPDTWYALSVAMIGADVVVNVDDVETLTYTDETPLTGGEIVLAGGSAVLVDDIFVYDLSDEDSAQTTVPYALDETHVEKLGAALFGLLDTYTTEGNDAAIAYASDYFMVLNDTNQLEVVVWGADGITADALTVLVAEVGGIVTGSDNADSVTAFVGFEGLLMLVNEDDIRAISQPMRAVSTSVTSVEQQAEALGTGGTIKPHSLDTIGANGWHEAGVRGAGVNIGVIDTGFLNFNTVGAETDCLGAAGVSFGATGGTSHGTNVVEIICDIAPDSSVFMYQVGSAAVIDDAINAAVANQMDIIVITVEDQLGGADTNAINNAIAVAFNLDIPVIASAGNTGGSGGRAFGFGGTGGTINIRASAGSVISYSWDEPGVPQNYESTLTTSDGQVLDSRTTRVGTAAHQYTVPSSCGESCQLSLSVSGDAPTTLEVRTASGLSGAEVMGSPDMTQFNVADSLTTAANSPNAIGVGAVCSDVTATANNPYTIRDRFRILADSSIGPAGQLNTPAIKPEIVSMSYVATSLTSTLPECIPDEGGSSSGVGFGGTSASAAHVAGMSALLFSNTQNAAMSAHFSVARPQRLEQYLMGHAIDLAVGAGAPDGFDNTFGAGLAVLGSPDFNINQRANYSTFAVLEGNILDSEAYYVGNADMGTAQTGSPSEPFWSPAFAVQQAVANNIPYVILQPGEYVAGFEIPDPTTSLTILSYDAADEVSRFGSSIAVTEGFLSSSGGGIYLNTVDSVEISGISFTGSSPLYVSALNDLRVAPPSPILVADSTNVTISDNIFTGFDAALEVGNSSDVIVLENTFDGFVVPEDSGVPVALTTALQVTGNTVIADEQTVLVEGNTFRNNSIGSVSSFNRRNSIVLIERVQADLFRNRFIGNTAGAVITIDHWINEETVPAPTDYVTYPVNIYSSVFQDNNLFGPVINLYQGRQFRFINNTVVNHTLASNVVGALILVAGPNSNFAQRAGHQFDAVNNVFFNNIAPVGVFSDSTQNGQFIDCDSISGGTDNALRTNWFIPSSIPGGDCGTALAGNGNILTPLNLGDQQAVTDFAEARFFLDFDPQNPYRLLPYDIRNTNPGDPIPTAPPLGVDDGDNAVVTALLGYDIQNPGANPLPLDAMGLPRLIDRTNFDGNTANDIIDLGAYELSDPEPVSFLNDDGQLNVAASEDAGAITFDIDSRVIGGYSPYSFNFTNLPTIYDPDPFNACGGQPIAFDDEELQITYCPPEDFYYNGAVADSPIAFNYTATGLLDTGTTDLGLVNIQIAPANDGAPVSDADTQVIFTDLSTPVNYRLRPFVDFSPFISFSDPDEDDNPATEADTDYPFMFDQFVVDASAAGHQPLLLGIGANPTQGEMNAAIDDAVNNGVFQFTPASGIDGAIEFTYRVTDLDGETATRRARLVVTKRIAGPGLHDDASLDFVYQDGWLPFYFETAINNTWHYTTAGESVDFFFIGDAFSLNFYGFAGGASYQIEIDPDDTGALGAANYNTYAELSCTIEPKPETLSTNIAIAGTTTFGCEGLDDIPGAKSELRRLRITNVTPGTTLILDAISVRSANGLPPGTYSHADFQTEFDPLAPTPPTGWITNVPDPNAFSGTLGYTNVINASMTFDVDGDLTDTMLFYYTAGPGLGLFDIYVNGIRRQTVDTNSPVLAYAQTALVTGIGSGKNTVEIRNISTGYSVVEGMQLLQAQTALNEGSYSAEDARLTYLGSWLDFATPDASDGTLRYSVDSGAVAVFRINGSGVNISRTLAPSWGAMEVCVGATCRTFTGSSASVFWGTSSSVYTSSSGIQTVTVRSLDAAPIGIDSVQVFGDPVVLGAGFYNDDAPELSYAGNWIRWSLPQMVEGTGFYTDDASAALSFNVDLTQTDRIAVYHPTGVGWGTIQVCGNTCQLRVLFNSPTAYSQAFLLNKADLGFTTETEGTITISSGGGFISVEGVQVLGAPSPLAPGYYEETQQSTAFNLTYSGDWLDFFGAGVRGGSIKYTDNTGASASFTVIPNDIEGIVIYHTGGPGYGTMQVCRNVDNNCQNIPNTNVVTTFGNRTFISNNALNLTGTAATPITIKPAGNGFIGFEAFHIVSQNPSADTPNYGQLTTGENLPTDDSIIYASDWVDYIAPGPESGEWVYTVDSTAAAYFWVDGAGIVINRGINPGYGPFEVCIDGNNCTFFTGDAVAFEWQEPTAIWFDTPGAYAIEIRNLSAAVVAIESIEVIDSARPVLATGEVYNPDDIAVEYGGLWSVWQQAGLVDNTSVYTTDTTATIDFRVNANTTDEIVIYHPTGAAWGTMQVCRNEDENCQPVTLTNVIEDLAVPTRINAGAGGLNLTGTNALVTIRATSGFSAVEAIQPVQSQALTPDYYDTAPINNDYNITYNNVWIPVDGFGPRGGNVYYATGTTNTATFDVIPAQTDGIVVYHTGGAGFGAMNVCNGGNCETINNTTQVGVTFGNRTFIPSGDLNLGTGTNPVTITISPQSNTLYIGLEGIQVIGANSGLPLLPDGLNASTSDNLRYIGSWVDAPTTLAEGDNLAYSNDPSAAVMFRINGGGITLYRTVVPGWGAFEICIDGDQCEIFTNNGVLTTYAQPVSIVADTGIGEHVVEIRSLDALFMGIEAIEVFDSVDVLAPGLYLNQQAGLNYTNVATPGLFDWTQAFVATTTGGSYVYTNDPADSLNFNVDATVVQELAIYHPGGVGWGIMEVCNASNQCVTRNLATSALANANVWEIPIGVNAGELNLVGTNEEVTISSQTGFIAVEAIEIRGAVAPLSPGLYQENNYNITTTGTWLPLPGAIYYGGQSIYTTEPNATLSFQIGNGATGFGIYVSRFAAGISSPMEVCLTRTSNGESRCEDLTTVSDTGLTQDIYGYSFYGLPSRNNADTQDEVYDVTITNTSPNTSQFLLIDAIAVFGEHEGNVLTTTTPGTPGGSPVVYDTTPDNVTLEPAPFWLSGVAAGYFGDTFVYTNLAGSIAQTTIEANSITIYQTAFVSASRNVNFCVNTPTSAINELQCSSFSQNTGLTTLGSPITLYGFGFAEQDIIFENRDYGFSFLIDAFEIR